MEFNYLQIGRWVVVNLEDERQPSCRTAGLLGGEGTREDDVCEDLSVEVLVGVMIH